MEYDSDILAGVNALQFLISVSVLYYLALCYWGMEVLGILRDTV